MATKISNNPVSNWWKRVDSKLGWLHLPNWLIILLVIALLLRIPSFFEPYSYGDEMIYLTLGQAIKQKVTLYKFIHDNKPPLLYLTAAIAGNLFWFKAILAFWSLLTIVLFWKLSKALFAKNKLLQKVSTVIFTLLITIPLLEGNIANAENFMMAPTILAFTILLSKKLTRKNLLFSGALFSMATLFKVPAAFDLPVIIFLWIIINFKNKEGLKKIITQTFYLMIGFITPIFITFVWYYFKGALPEYSIAAFLQNVGYLSSFRPSDVREPFLTRNAPLLWRALIVFLGALVLFIKKNKLSKQFIFLTAWVLLSLFAVTLSERPYPHYLLQTAPAISLLFGLLFTKKSLEQSLSIIPLGLVFLVPVYFNFWHYPTVSYYQRFIKLVTNNMTKNEYLDTFGGHIRRNYEVAKFVRTSTKDSDRIYVWGDTSIVYALSKRLPPIKYVADYHINDFSSKAEVAQQLTDNKPKLIILLPNSPPIPEITPLLKTDYLLISLTDGVEIWSKI